MIPTYFATRVAHLQSEITQKRHLNFSRKRIMLTFTSNLLTKKNYGPHTFFAICA